MEHQIVHQHELVPHENSETASCTILGHITL